MFLLQTVDAALGSEQPGRGGAVDSVQTEVSWYCGAGLEVHPTQSSINRGVVAQQIQAVNAFGESSLAQDLGRPDPVIVEVMVGLEVSPAPTDTTDGVVGPTADVPGNIRTCQDPVGVSFVDTDPEQYELEEELYFNCEYLQKKLFFFKCECVLQ